jgi:hypothetical protein
MYFPKSQIKTNLYTKGGEYSFFNSSSSYVGYYYKTSDERYFSGRTPNESPSFELFKFSPEDSSLTLSIGTINDYYKLEEGYLQSTNLSFNSTPPPLPKQSYPIVTENDYKLGEFQRYFLKKGNETKFIEISLEDYRKYVNRDSSAMFELYTPIQISWVLTGEKEQVYQTNQNIVAKAEREQNLPGFTQYFRDKFTQFYR